jgi:hypothetical protein
MTAYRATEVSEDEFYQAWSFLIRTGLAWSLQGFYGRTAASFIQEGLFDKEGNILGNND